eukprot:CAMPEP_0170388740 /NCGR_PEP_ID=MMETSP0117_2-20130122/18251_1 /TAXON_ID=400756 /ORGANISM="Durinskia baltica, Strain CSIRO CS-38" /LENGTH=144 /DNA_ID=CAMNT_0010644693 /DNA_START=79 /DNA_END=511 /DNA_ORIENTATION=+
MPHYPDEIEYSDKYEDDRYEYRHVILTKPIAKDMYRLTQGKRLLDDAEWRGLGVQQSRGWVHYEIHRPEPHILLFRRPLGTDPTTGRVAAVEGADHGVFEAGALGATVSAGGCGQLLRGVDPRAGAPCKPHARPAPAHERAQAA